MTAREKLLEIMQERKWYRDKINPGTARRYKKILTENGPISDEKVKEILEATFGLKIGIKKQLKSTL